jgi:predicted NUDIX family NTP pyrophosphohydrolase
MLDMPRTSAGILLYRVCRDEVSVLLVHPGGPFFKNKDAGAWSIPKGEVAADEEPLDCARREFREEIGVDVAGPFKPLQPVKQKGGKIVQAWAVEGECDVANVVSNTFRLEWPPRSGRFAEFPEIDRAEFFDVATAKEKINPAQAALIDELVEMLRKK